jgi:hypothetical protein
MNFESLTWAGAEGEHNNHPLLIRFREFPKKFPKSKYPKRINIFWEMSETDENGLPTEDEFNKLETFEERLADAVEHDEHSILAAALTCNGEREFIFFTADVAGFMERLTNMPQERARYPITIQTYDDPTWSYFESVVP